MLCTSIKLVPVWYRTAEWHMCVSIKALQVSGNTFVQTKSSEKENIELSSRSSLSTLIFYLPSCQPAPDRPMDRNKSHKKLLVLLYRNPCQKLFHIHLQQTTFPTAFLPALKLIVSRPDFLINCASCVWYIARNRVLSLVTMFIKKHNFLVLFFWTGDNIQDIQESTFTQSLLLEGIWHIYH